MVSKREIKTANAATGALLELENDEVSNALPVRGGLRYMAEGLKYALRSNDAVTPQPSVETSYGVVIITGEATSDAEKALVTKIAQSVRGVKSVSNNMTVKGS
jgi:osmotically-inducible protein OsmY